MDMHFLIDEQPLRDCILKAYHEKRGESEKSRLAIDAVRQFLSGAPGGETVPGRYWFQEDPEACVHSLLEDLERADDRLADLVVAPLVEAYNGMLVAGERQLAPNLRIFVSSLAGSCAVKAEIDETVASALVASVIVGLSRLGSTPFEEQMARRRRGDDETAPDETAPDETAPDETAPDEA